MSPTPHWSQRPAKAIARLDLVRAQQLRRGAQVVSYDPGRELVVYRRGERVTYAVDEHMRVGKVR